MPRTKTPLSLWKSAVASGKLTGSDLIHALKEIERLTAEESKAAKREEKAENIGRVSTKRVTNAADLAYYAQCKTLYDCRLTFGQWTRYLSTSPLPDWGLKWERVSERAASGGKDCIVTFEFYDLQPQYYQECRWLRK